MSPISSAKHPPVVLPLEQALDLALRVLGDVGAVGVEEAHDDRLGVAGRRRTDRPPNWRGDRTRNRVTGMLTRPRGRSR